MFNRVCRFLLLLGFSACSQAEEAPAPPVVLLELFTSQGCYSCPPAEKLVREYYTERAGVVPLEFHVDYWDELVYGSAGSWKDPFSSRAHTDRQISYNLSLRGKRGAFTPQMVIQGRHQSGGTQRGRIDSFIKKEEARRPTLSLYFGGSPAEGLTARLKGNLHGREELYYAVYWLHQTTEIPSGENKGKTLESSNIVKEVGQRAATRRQLSVPPFNPEEEGCVVWAQRARTGAVLVAARCPSS